MTLARVTLSPHDERVALTALAVRARMRHGFSSSVEWGGSGAVCTNAFAAGTAAGMGNDVGFFSILIRFGAGRRLMTRGGAVFAARRSTASS